ncbi:MAG: hypothetical protein P8Y47_01140 [Alphaproteobacteria bacterium]
MNEVAQAFTLCRWANPVEAPFTEAVFLFDSDDLPEDLSNASVVLRDRGAERARDLLTRGAARVLLGDAALKDSGVVASLAKEIGTEKVGLWVPVRRMTVSWALDTVSNADFSCITPSRGKLAWEALLSNGTPTGADVTWWITQMFERGASMALIAADLHDDADLNICAEIAEQHGSRLWLTPLSRPDAPLRPWVEFGHVRNLVLPVGEPCHAEKMAALVQMFTPMEASATA